MSWNKLRLRTKIVITLLPALLPVLIIVAVTHRSARNNSLDHSRTISQLVVENGAADLNTYLGLQVAQYQDWVREDVYGLAIEFDATRELADRFREMLIAAPGFSMLALTDQGGEVLQATASSQPLPQLTGRIAAEATPPNQTATCCATLTDSPLLTTAGFPFNSTFVFVFTSKDSSGQPNGRLLAYLDWTELETRVARINNVFLANGLPDAQTSLLDSCSAVALAHSDTRKNGQTLDLSEPLLSWLSDGTRSEQVHPFNVGGMRQYLAAAAVVDPGDAIVGADSLATSSLSITSFIPEKNILTGVQRTLRLSIALAVAGAVVLFGLMWFTGGRIASRIRTTAAMLKDIAEGEGDLTKRLEAESSDELGELGRWFNTFADKLQGIIRDITANADTLAKGSMFLSTTANQLAGGAAKTTEQSATVASAAAQMSDNMNQMAASTEEMSANIQTVASAVEEMTVSIGEVASNAERAASVANNASRLADDSNHNVGELGDAADEIGKVIEVIQDIAEQTNLLALNATIEAARAGDAGKGFAVVATEVKELAKQTASATEDIRRRIEGIQGSTADTVRSIGEIREVIRQVNDISRVIASAVEEQSVTTNEIAHKLGQAATSAEAVSTGVAQSASASQEITANITGVDHAAKQSAEGATQTQAASQELSTLGEQLQTLVGQFKA